jgi:hypothetical protein
VDYVAYGDRQWPVGTSERVRKIALASSVGGPFTNEDWEIVAPQVIKGEVGFKSVSTMGLDVAATSGTYELRIRDGVENYGVPVRVGRGRRFNAADGTILNISPNDNSADFSSPTYTPRADHAYGGVRTASPSWVYAGANDGLHKMIGPDPIAINQLGTLVRIAHARALGEEGRFTPRPNSNTDYSSFTNDTPVAWEVFSPGEVVTVIRNDRSTNRLYVAHPGILHAKALGDLVELHESVPFERRGLDHGLDTITVDVDRDMVPTGSAFDSFTVRARSIPDGWRALNVTEANCINSLWGRTTNIRLRLEGDGNGDIMLERDLPEALAYRGREVRISAWVEQTVLATGGQFRIDVSYDGFNFSNGPVISVDGSVTDGFAIGQGGGDPTFISRTVEIPFDATHFAFRVSHAGSLIGDRIFIEKVIVANPEAQGLFLGSNTVPRHETHQQFGELLYIWSPSELDNNERRSIGLPQADDAYIGGTGNGIPPDTIVEEWGHLDWVVNSHGYWERIDISEYTPAGDPINVIGIHDETEWGACTLTNLTVFNRVPGRLSHVRPTAPTLVEGEELSVTAPSNATLAATSRHEGAFPQAAEGGDTLYEDDQTVPLTPPNNTRADRVAAYKQLGVPVPAIGYPGDRASATIGTHGVNGEVVMTVDAPGSIGNSWTVTVVVPGAGPTPLIATKTSLTSIQVSLAVDSGATPVDDFNRALFVAQAIDALDGVSATWEPGDGSDRLDTAQGPITFAGADVLPWRFLNATNIQIDVGYYNPNAIYVIDYERLTRAETPVLDLGTNYNYYLWFIDAAIYRRVEPALIERERTVQVQFRADFRATLAEISNGDQTTATLYQDTGITRTEVARLDWRFVDNRTVEIESDLFDSDSVYTLEYVAQLGTFPRQANYVLEHRSDTTSGGVVSQPWRAVEPGDLVDRTHQWHQLRITITDVTVLSDIRVKSLGLKGIRFYDPTSPYAPGIIRC